MTESATPCLLGQFGGGLEIHPLEIESCHASPVEEPYCDSQGGVVADGLEGLDRLMNFDPRSLSRLNEAQDHGSGSELQEI